MEIKHKRCQETKATAVALGIVEIRTIWLLPTQRVRFVCTHGAKHSCWDRKAAVEFLVGCLLGTGHVSYPLRH